MDRTTQILNAIPWSWVLPAPAILTGILAILRLTGAQIPWKWVAAPLILYPIAAAAFVWWLRGFKM